MTSYKFRRLVEKKQRRADKLNKLVDYELKENRINAYDLIKEDYMMGKYEDITDRQLEIVCERSYRYGRGGVNVKC